MAEAAACRIPGSRVQGLILSGGQSRRMRTALQPDADKGLMSWRGHSLVARACGLMRIQGISGIRISANRHLLDYALHAPVLTDPTGLAGRGPLAGVLAGLLHGAGDWLLVVPVDVPNLPDDLLARLSGVARVQHPVYAVTPAGPHPLCLLVHRSRRTSLEEFLHGGQRRVQGWLARERARCVRFEPATEWLNLNTPADWA